MKTLPSTQSAMRTQHWGWISGWGYHPAMLAQVARDCWPHHQHTVVAPTPSALSKLRALNLDVLAGYSLGSLLLLSDASGSTVPTRIAFAPILAFDAEVKLGGKTPQRSRQAVAARFERSPTIALKLYLRLAGLSDLASEKLPYAEEDLKWGLEALGKLRALPQNLSNSKLFLGDQDSLVDSSFLASRIPHLKISPHVNHDFRTLFPAVAAQDPKL